MGRHHCSLPPVTDVAYHGTATDCAVPLWVLRVVDGDAGAFPREVLPKAPRVPTGNPTGVHHGPHGVTGAQVRGMAGAGRSVRSIARALGMTEANVCFHLRRGGAR